MLPLSPNEEARLQQQCRQRERKERLLEVRRREKETAGLIRQNYLRKKKQLHGEDIAEAQKAFMKRKEEKLGEVYDGIRKSLISIGTGHMGAEVLDEEQCQQVSNWCTSAISSFLHSFVVGYCQRTGVGEDACHLRKQVGLV